VNLLPNKYVERTRSRARSSRVAVLVMLVLGTIVAFATHSRFAVNSASKRLTIGQARANAAIELEVDATSLKQDKDALKEFIKQYESEAVVFEMRQLVSTVTNLLPDTITLEELALDIVESSNGKGISGRLAGFAKSDEVIAEVVTSLQEREPFSAVRMDFSKSRSVREQQARGFKISFFIDLDQRWTVTNQFATVEDNQ